MPPKPRYVRMEKDDLAWEKSDEEVDKWERSLHNAETYRAITNLIIKYRPGEPRTSQPDQRRIQHILSAGI